MQALPLDVQVLPHDIEEAEHGRLVLVLPERHADDDPIRQSEELFRDQAVVRALEGRRRHDGPSEPGRDES